MVKQRLAALCVIPSGVEEPATNYYETLKLLMPNMLANGGNIATLTSY